MTLVRSFAGADDDGDFARFRCWDGDSDNFFAEEAEIWIRNTGLLYEPGTFNLAFRADGVLVAVASFYRRSWPIPPPADRPAWHLDVMAIHRDRQRAGLSAEVFAGTFEVMREVEPDRVLISGFIHRLNFAAYAACSAVGITLWTPRDEDYVIVIGEVPPA
jgi:hypothetical protein